MLSVGVTLGATERRAFAQTSGTTSGTLTGTTGGPSVTSALLNPTRLINGNAQTLRDQNLNPEGVSYSDCINDMVLEFSISLNSFNNGSSLLVWVGQTGPCNSTTARGLMLAPVCWPAVPNNGTQLSAIFGGPGSVNTITVDVRVQDLVAHMNAPTGAYTRATSDVCTTVQQSFTSVPLTIWFMPVDQGNNMDDGTPYSYPISVDLVGPPPPSGLNDTVGDTLFNINWTPNADSDTAGYDIYIDPIPGATDTTITGASDGSVNVLYCDDAGTSTPTQTPTNVGDAEMDAASDASLDATVADTSVDATTSSTCLNPHYGPPPMQSTSSAGTGCGGVSVFSGTVIDGGTVTVTDEAGVVTTQSGSGGISTVPSANLVGVNAGFTVSSPTSSQYTITGLTNNVHYHVSVSAVDAFGNIGPPAVEVCDFPAPVNDFWANYRNDGGLAGGGFCDLGAVGFPVGPTVAFGALGTGLLGVFRRRRRRR